MKPVRFIIYTASLLLCGAIGACRKDFLDVSPSISLAVPESLADYQSLLDNSQFMDYNPGYAEISADNYYISYTVFQTANYDFQNCYTWTSNTWAGGSGTDIADWVYPYSAVYTADVVLAGLPSIQPTAATSVTWNFIKGQALWLRAFNLYNLAQEFAQPYKPASAASDEGLPLKLTSDANVVVPRSNVEATYNQIVQDLLQAKDLLSNVGPDVTKLNRPSKATCLGLLARTYLIMQDYTDAGKYADSSLSYYNTLIDYNNLNPATRVPFPKANPEVLVEAYQVSFGILGVNTTTYTDSVLYASYAANDLRKKIYFNLNTSTGLPYFRGNYTGNSLQFIGVATDEMYLTRAECYARGGDATDAMNDLNTLMVKRWNNMVPFPTYTATSATDALNQILTERRKELCFRGLRWADLRRLNQDPAYAITLQRLLNGTTYSLPPNDLRYTLLIPLDEIQLSGIQQNSR